MPVAKKTPPIKRAAKPKPALPTFSIGQKLIEKGTSPTIVGKTTSGEWIVENDNFWGGIDLNTYTTAQLAKEFKILEG